MASLDEVVALAQSNMSSVDDARGSIESTKAKAQEVQSLFAGLGADAKASEAAALQQTAEQAQQLWDPVKQKLEELVSHAQAMKTLNSSSAVASSPTYTIDPANKTVDVGHIDTRPVVGDPVEAPGGGPAPFRQELAGADDDDSRRSKFSRAGRAMVRKSSDIKAQLKTTSEARVEDATSFDPPAEQGNPTVGMPSGPTEEIHGVQAGAPVHDMVTSAAMMAVFAVEGFSRVKRQKRGK